LMRGTEGETVAHAKRAQAVEWFRHHQHTTLIERQQPVDDMPPLPRASDAATTAHWIKAALAGDEPVPVPIAEQLAQCLHVVRQTP